MESEKKLLTDEQVRHFVMNGYVQVETELAALVHEAAHENTKKAFRAIKDLDSDRKYNPGNNILPMVPELAQVLGDPNVDGALTSLLGENYLIHPHRHCHPNFPVQKETTRTTIMGIHKDGHADGNPKPRHRHPRWALLFYNPHPCPDELGPTCIAPGSHYYHRIIKNGSRERNVKVASENGHYVLPDNYVNRHFLPVTSTLGTVSILHFDTVHSVITNIGDIDRYAHKFVIMRTENPEKPSWDAGDSLWSQDNLGHHSDHRIMWTYMWNWMNGRKDLYSGAANPNTGVADLKSYITSSSPDDRLMAANELGLHRQDAASAVTELIQCLRDPVDSVRLNAVYALGAIGEAAVGGLIDDLASDSAFFEEDKVLNVSEATHALAAVGGPAVDALADVLKNGRDHERAWSAFALGEIGSEAERAIPVLVDALEDDSEYVRRHAVSALGIIGKHNEDSENRLLSIFANDPIVDLRIYALQGLIRLSAKSGPVLEALSNALHDPHPYIAAFSSELLYRNGGSEYGPALLEYLRPLRWFPYTKT